MHIHMYTCTHAEMDGRADIWANGRTDVWTYGRMGVLGLTFGRMDVFRGRDGRGFMSLGYLEI